MGEHHLIGKRVSAAEVADTLSLSTLSALAQAMEPDVWRAVSDNAQTVAQFLLRHPRVCEVRYPGLRSDPLYQRASCTLQRGFGPYVAFRLFQGDTWILWQADKSSSFESCMLFEEMLSESLSDL